MFSGRKFLCRRRIAFSLEKLLSTEFVATKDGLISCLEQFIMAYAAIPHESFQKFKPFCSEQAFSIDQ